MTNDYKNSSFPVERRAQGTPTSWHFKKEISLSIIISVITLGVAVLFAYTDLQRDLALIQSSIVMLNQQDLRLKTEIDVASSTSSSRFDRVDGKLDRLIERTAK